MRTFALTLLLLIGLPQLNAAALSGKAVIQPTGADSTAEGELYFTETREGLAVSGEISGLPMGNHGIHIHDYGDCSDGGKAAGGHYNPHAVQHGFLPDDGPEASHAGDMGNITIGEDGFGDLELLLPGVMLANGPISVAGRAVILHADKDDFGQPTGNAGGRIGCGAIILIADPE